MQKSYQISRPARDPLLPSLAQQVTTLTLTPLVRLKTLATFWAIKRSKRTKIRKVIKLEQSPQKPVVHICASSSYPVKKTIIAHCVDDNVQRRQCNNATMGTVQPSGWIWRCQCWVDAPMCVGVEGRQEGKGGRARRRCIFAHAHHAIGVTEFFLATQCGWFNA